MKKVALNLIPGIITLLFVVVLLFLRGGSTPWKLIDAIESLSFIYVCLSFLFSPYLMVINYKSITRKTAIPFYILIVFECIGLLGLMCCTIITTKYMGMENLWSLLIYGLPLAFTYTVPVALWPMLCCIKLAKNGLKAFYNLCPMLLGAGFTLILLFTKVISIEWHFIETGAFEIRLIILLIIMPIYSIFVNRDHNTTKSFFKSMFFSLISSIGLLMLLYFCAERLRVEKYYLYLVLYEFATFVIMWLKKYLKEFKQ